MPHVCTVLVLFLPPQHNLFVMVACWCDGREHSLQNVGSMWPLIMMLWCNYDVTHIRTQDNYTILWRPPSDTILRACKGRPSALVLVQQRAWCTYGTHAVQILSYKVPSIDSSNLELTFDLNILEHATLPCTLHTARFWPNGTMHSPPRQT